MAIKFLILFTLSAHTMYAQKGTLYLRPALGIQMPVSKLQKSNYTKGKLTNNNIVPYPYLAINMEYALKNRNHIFLLYTNSLAGYAILEKSIACNNGYTGQYTGRKSKSSAVENIGLQAGYRLALFKKAHGDKATIQPFFQSGIGIDIKSGVQENGSQIILPGTNRCGEVYYLQDTVFLRRNISWVLPLQLSFQWYNKKQKPRLQLALFANIGLTTNMVFDVNYVNETLNTVERAHFISRGSSYGFSLSYPIRLRRGK